MTGASQHGPVKLEVEGSLWVTDPCYAATGEPSDDFSLLIQDAGGTWLVSTEVGHQGDWGTRVRQLLADRVGCVPKQYEVVRELGVDAGLMSVVPGDRIPVDYELLLQRLLPAWPAVRPTTTEPIVIPRGTRASNEVGGIVAYAGYGDGIYPCEVGYDGSGKPASIKVTFIDDEE